MDAFSSKPEDSLCKEITVDPELLSITCEEDLINAFDLGNCVNYIVDKHFSRVSRPLLNLKLSFRLGLLALPKVYKGKCMHVQVFPLHSA